MEFAPPPLALKARKPLPKGGVKRSRKDKDPSVEEPLSDVGQSTSEGALGEGGEERALHGDAGHDGKGRWRASLAENGKVSSCVFAKRRLAGTSDGVWRRMPCVFSWVNVYIGRGGVF